MTGVQTCALPICGTCFTITLPLVLPESKSKVETMNNDDAMNKDESMNKDKDLAA